MDIINVHPDIVSTLREDGRVDLFIGLTGGGRITPSNPLPRQDQQPPHPLHAPDHKISLDSVDGSVLARITRVYIDDVGDYPGWFLALRVIA